MLAEITRPPKLHFNFIGTQLHGDFRAAFRVYFACVSYLAVILANHAADIAVIKLRDIRLAWRN